MARAWANGPAGASFVLQTAGGAAFTGPLEAVEENWAVRLGGAEGGRAEGREVVSLRLAGKPLPANPVGEQVVLANGDRLPGLVRKLAGEQLPFVVRMGKEQVLNLPLSALSVFWLTAPEGADQETLLRQLATARRKRDTVILRNGDTMEGVLTALDRKELRLEANRRQVTVEFDKVAAVALSTDLVRPPRTQGAYGHLVLANGGRLALVSCRTVGGVLEGKTLFGEAVSIPVDDVVALDMRQGSVVYLSDLRPRAYTFTPYLGTVRWPYVADGSVAEGTDAGRDLRVAGGTFDKGLGLHSGAHITYDLAGGYRRFEALVGTDDHEPVWPKGRPTVEVLVDGKPRDLGAGRVLHPGKAVPISVDVTGARALTLVVGFGETGEVGGRVNWADARLVR